MVFPLGLAIAAPIAAKFALPFLKRAALPVLGKVGLFAKGFISKPSALSTVASVGASAIGGNPLLAGASVGGLTGGIPGAVTGAVAGLAVSRVKTAFFPKKEGLEEITKEKAADVSTSAYDQYLKEIKQREEEFNQRAAKSKDIFIRTGQMPTEQQVSIQSPLMPTTAETPLTIGINAPSSDELKQSVGIMSQVKSNYIDKVVDTAKKFGLPAGIAAVGLAGAGLITAKVISGRKKDKVVKRRVKRRKLARRKVKRRRVRRVRKGLKGRKLRRTKRRFSKGQSHFAIGGKGARGTHKLRFTKKGQPFVIMKSGRARFIPRKSARIASKRSGGYG